MPKKFVIVNNGLRDHCGHYYETSVALAEAARRNGLHPVLATHVHCPASLLPDWLESYPIFCTDHWMSEPPAEPPDLGDLGPDLYSSQNVTVESVRRGDATIRDFIASRFNSLPPSGAGEVAASGGKGSQRVQDFCASYLNVVWAIERFGYYTLPPFLHASVRRVMHWTVPRLLVPQYHPRIRTRLGEMLFSQPVAPSELVIDYGPSGQETARVLADTVQRQLVGQALVKLRSLNLAYELEHAMIFKRDLERLLTVARVGPGDHVLLGTAHAREVIAVFLVAQRLGEDRCPNFHLEFRHPLFQSRAVAEELASSPVVKLHRAFLSLYEQWGPLDRIKFYTDTEELSDDFNRLSDVPFGVLPIPFRSELIEPARQAPGEPLRVVFLGQARDEKGFHWLPDLIDDLMADYVATGRVRFLLQANLGAPQYNPRSAAALERLKEHPPEVVQLFGLDGPVTPEEYYQLVSEANIVLLPYDRERYRAASSGTLADALAGGRPVVVPSQSWMESQLPHGAGETFDDYGSFVGAVRRLIDHYPERSAQAQERRADWLAEHTPDALVKAVMGEPGHRRVLRLAA